MYEKLCVILLILQVAFAQDDSHRWDIAVVVGDTIELLQSNGTIIGSTIQELSILKAVTFDNVRHQFLVSGMEDQENSLHALSEHNDTIFAVPLTKETDMTPVIIDLPDDVQDLSVDPITDTLFWTDTIKKSINYISLRNSSYQSKVLLEFADKSPQGIAFDICGRKMYWTNPNFERPTIEVTTLDTLETKVLIDEDLFAPYGISVDYYSKRVYWVDMRQGIYYRIESSNMDGKERELVDTGTHSRPFGIAVDANFLYWTDVSNNALWRISKFEPQKEIIRTFNQKPMGIVAKNYNIKNLEDCKNLADVIQDYKGKIKEENIFPVTTTTEAQDLSFMCLNGGVFIEESCKCPRGFAGKYCEVSLCHNYCLHGECRLSQSGYLSCHCANGYTGRRCERNICDGYCLNGGECIYRSSSQIAPRCSCLNGFGGSRCEKNLNAEHICSMFCEGKEDDTLISRNDDFICRCDHGSYSILTSSNGTAEMLASSEEHLPILEHFQDPAFLILSAIMLIMLIIVLVLAYFVCTLKRRPRIKKRIIVNKNVTPLTYRPHPNSEQCEITIENCCNMNVCETPCFEPPKLRTFTSIRHDDKRKLLSNMENGEDHY